MVPITPAILLAIFCKHKIFYKFSAKWHLSSVQQSVKNFIDTLEMIIARPTHQLTCGDLIDT
jgi:hypothetical protein